MITLNVRPQGVYLIPIVLHTSPLGIIFSSVRLYNAAVCTVALIVGVEG